MGPLLSAHLNLNEFVTTETELNAMAPAEIASIVVDEDSMLDLPLAYRLLKSVPRGCHLLLVGDVDQLPSDGLIS